MATWKSVERRIAEAIGGQRVSDPGRSSPDVIDDGGYLVAEVKHRAKLPKWIKAGLKQAQRHAKSDQTAVLVLHEKYKRAGDCLVVMDLQTFLRLWD